jgi:tetratricopeptide (TPR) repeat protein
MPSSYIGFRFRYINEQGKPTSFFYHQARIDDSSGIMLGSDSIPIADIRDASLYGNQMAIVLRPYLALSKGIAENIIPNTSSFVIEIPDGLATDAKSALDQHRSALATFAKKKRLIQEGKGSFFRVEQCPHCDAVIDLTGLKETNYFYCKYCEIIFDKHKALLPKSENYKVCPECNYYNRVQEYPEFHFYAFPKKRKASYKNHICCDTCAQRYHEQTAWRNIPYLVGIPFNFMLKNKMSKGVNEFYQGLTEANRFAQDGNIIEADVLYGLILLRNEQHPAILFNMAQAYYKSSQLDKAYRYFEKSLENCSNYQPTLDFLELHKEEKWFKL